MTVRIGGVPLFLAKLLGSRFDKKKGNAPYPIIVGLCALLMAAAPATPADELAKLLNDQAAAWTRGDLTAFCSVYAEDATFLAPSGLTKSRQAVVDRYRAKYVDKTGMGTLTLAVDEVRALSADAASVVARWKLTWPDKPEASGLTLLVFKKTREGWRIVQDASM